METFISNSRLRTYERILSLSTADKQLKAYYWNKRLCAALYPAMQALEITLRNALNESVKSNGAGTYKGNDWWFEHIAIKVQDKKIKNMSAYSKTKWLKPDGNRKKQGYQEAAIKKAINDLTKEGRVPVFHDDVLSRPTFGYWLAFIHKDYEDVTNKNLLWPNLLTSVFPNCPGKVSLDKVSERLGWIKDLRNRMSHHEPVWKFYSNKPNGSPDYSKPIYGLNASITILAKQYNEILETISWMSQGRYESFLDAGLDIEFRKLCSINGFNALVKPHLVKPVVARSRAKREARKILEDSRNGIVTRITRAGKTYAIIGVHGY
ncbi:Abi family protein [Neptunomonas japonica]|uniref:Abi family protein n=1 Tax=Neptunomonas japonica TaxID=417574 RepID=UPI0003FE198F|nr:Abi family protein [Neptunomonas japonica]